MTRVSAVAIALGAAIFLVAVPAVPAQVPAGQTCEVDREELAVLAGVLQSARGRIEGDASKEIARLRREVRDLQEKLRQADAKEKAK